MANQKVKHIIAKLVGQSTESTLDVYDVDAVHTDKIANNLTTTSSGYVLDARQGKALNDSLSALAPQINASPSYTVSEKITVNSMKVVKVGSLLFVVVSLNINTALNHNDELFVLSGYGSPVASGDPTCLLSSGSNVAKIRPFNTGASSIRFSANGAASTGTYYIGTLIAFVS